MAHPYHTNLTRRIAALTLPADIRAEVTIRHFISGAAAYYGADIFMTLTPAGLAVKLGATDLREALRLGATRLRYFPKAPIKKDYAVLPERLVENRQLLAVWVGKGLEYAGAK